MSTAGHRPGRGAALHAIVGRQSRVRGTVTDNFNRADNATSLGTTSDGIATWNVVQGTAGITSNQAYFPALSAGFAKAIFDAGLTDVDARVDTAGNATGVIIRYTDTSNFWYAGGDGLYKVQSGSFTKLVSSTWTSLTATLEVIASGTTLTYKKDGAVIGSTTSTFNQTATICGLYSQTTTDRFDNFSVATLTPPPPYHRPFITTRNRAVNRASVI
jgi:hypothetical protein